MENPMPAAIRTRKLAQNRRFSLCTSVPLLIYVSVLCGWSWGGCGFTG